MELTEVFERIAPSVVALGVRQTTPLGGDDYANIIGTGFVVDPRGIVVTAGHIVETLMAADERAFAMPFENPEPRGDKIAARITLVDIRDYAKLSAFESVNGEFYGDEIPDIGFLQLMAKGVPALPMGAEPGVLRVGTSIAFCGYPLGSGGLAPRPTSDEPTLNQIMPFLRSGIIASVFPFPCPQPSGFTIDAWSQGGASGSPILLAHEPTAIGMLCSKLEGSNITIALPGHVIKGAIEAALSGNALGEPPSQTIDKWRERAKRIRGFTLKYPYDFT
jgi:hypothetical protein